MDIAWISSEAKQIHSIFVSMFYLLATLLLLVGVIIDYFKLPIGGVPAFPQLVGRALVAAILLSAYPEISNAVAAIADAIANQLGSLNSYHAVLQSAGDAIKEHSWSWTSVGDTLLSVVSFAAYGILYLTVFFFDAAIVYCLTLLYIFSPIMIVFFILPQTASLTGGLFRTLIEIATWKIVWCVLGTLLWSTALNNFKNGSQGNFITMLALTLLLAFSLMLTPLVVRNLISGTLSSIAAQTAGLAATSMTAGLMGPAALAAGSKVVSAKAGSMALAPGKFIYRGGKNITKRAASFAYRKIKAKITNQEDPESQPKE